MPVEQWRHQLDVILTGNFLVTKHVSRLMIEQGRKGSIINIISTAGHQGEPWNVAYSTGKGGIAQLHPLRGHGAFPARHQGEQPDSHRH